jgi:aminomethyltransferase
MGVVELRGPGAPEVCQEMTTNDVRRLRDGRAQYSLLCNDRGGVIDDIIVYRLGAERFMLCVNAANTEGDLEWIRSRWDSRARIDDSSPTTALLALQGPRAAAVLRSLAGEVVGALPRFGCVETRVSGVLALVARTGYTGEDGFEMFVPAQDVRVVWEGLLAAEGGVVVPVGLGARDTLRLEAGLLLHGTDMDAGTSAYEADLGSVVKLDKGPFVGRDALMAEARAGIRRRIGGLMLRGPGVLRHEYPISRDGRTIGAVTSGGMSPMLGRGIALGYLERPYDDVGTPVRVEVRGRLLEAEVVRRPFYTSVMAGGAH